jgi:hypothetical protein
MVEVWYYIGSAGRMPSYSTGWSGVDIEDDGVLTSVAGSP